MGGEEMKKKSKAVWRRMVDSPTEVIATIGIVIITALGYMDKIEGAWLAGSLVALFYLWVGARVKSVGPSGIEIEDECNGEPD